jgi:hypothetical protein
VQFRDGTIDARRKPEVVGMEDQTRHRDVGLVPIDFRAPSCC